MRFGDWELKLVGGQACPEVDDSRGRCYAVASAGSAFTAHLTWFPAPYAPLPPPGAFYNAALYVDGQCVGYTKNVMQPGQPAIFDGFLKAGDTQGCAYQSFVFSLPQPTEDKSVDTLNFVEGTIKANVWLSVQTGEETAGRYHGPAATNESIAQLPEGKKFFLAPSLTTGKGELKLGGGFSRFQIQRMGGPLATLELRYETAATLLLRGVLRRDNVQHRAILQQFMETAPKDDPGEEEEEDKYAAGPSHAAAGHKRQRQGPAQPQQQQRHRRQRHGEDEEEEAIDLTKAPAEGDEVLAAKQQGQTLVCDLTEEQEEPQWKAVKEEAHPVE